MKTEIVKADHPTAIEHALDVLHHKGVIAFPTDTVYGLAANVFDRRMVESLYIIKGRNSTRAIAILIGKRGDLAQVIAEMNPIAAKLAEEFWPGPITLVVPRHPKLPDILSPTVNIGVRMPNHPFALDLLRRTGPLAVTSANLSGGVNATTAQEVLRQLDGRVHLILDGGITPGGIPSTVVDCSAAEPIILREGPISKDQINSILKIGLI
jgi:L-threonylcarbamoyladenylate synthase